MAKVTFLDGPGIGAQLNLSRTPLLLRVVVGPGGKVDALDLQTDKMQRGERVYVYILAGKPVNTFPHRPQAIYKLLENPPEEKILQDNIFWATWCDDRFDQLVPEWAKELVKKD